VNVVAELAAGALAILGSFAILGVALVGIGLIHRRAFGLTSLGTDGCFLAFWVGFGITVLVLLGWNFFGPVGVAAQIAILMLGLAGIVWNWTMVSSVVGNHWRRMGAMGRLSVIVCAVWMANQSTGAFRSYDGALYHLQGVQWAQAYPVVPGIANLHGPLAFNNSSFLFDAAVDSGVWKGGGFHVANGVLVLALVLQAIVSGSRFAHAGTSASPSDLFRFLSLAPVLYLVPLNGGITSYSTDVPLTLLLLVASGTMYRILDGGAGRETAPTADRYWMVALSVLMATAVTIKLTAGVFVAVSMAIVFWRWRKRAAGHTQDASRALIWMLAGIVAFAGLWVARGIVMSGYPFFPVSVAGLPVDWRAPVEHADAEMAYLAFTEREFTWRIIGWDWLRQALWDDVYPILVPACLAVAGTGACWVLRRREGGGLRLRETWWLVLPTSVAMAAWLVTAPSTRYCPALFWTLASLALCESVRIFWPRLAPETRKVVVAVVAALGVSPLLVEPVRDAVGRGENPVAAVVRHNLVMPPANGWFHPVLRQAEVSTFTTASGLDLNVPVRLPKPAGLPNACWGAPVPCTPNPAPNLRLREPGRLDRGFKLDGGDWEMRDWPYHWEPGFLPEWRKRRQADGW
jgi:hypothetical protein